MKVYFVDAFKLEHDPFSGNPAAVCLCDAPISSASMRMIAANLAQPETVFLEKKGSEFLLRWFTPSTEIVPGGNGTVAAAHVILRELNTDHNGSAVLASNSLPYTSQAKIDSNGLVSVELPAVSPRIINKSHRLIDAFGGVAPVAVLEGMRDVVAVFENEEEVRSIKPRFDVMVDLDWLGYIATAPGDYSAFVYRTFVPSAGLKECPGSGAALMNLVPYWHYRIQGLATMRAEQLSPRGGEAYCRYEGDRIIVSSLTRTVGTGDFYFDEMNLSDNCSRTDECVVTSWI